MLVTGAGGFLGAALCERLEAEGVPFTGVVSPSAAARPPYVALDLRDLEAAEALVREADPSLVVNLAALGVSPGDLDLAALHAVNVELPARLFAAMPEGATLVQAGSMAQYAGGDAPLDEEAPQASATPYAASKHAAERALLALPPRGPLVLTRLFGVVGPGERPHRLLPVVVAGALAGREIPLSDGAQVRDVLHVDDVAAALLHLGRRGAAGTFNVGRGSGVSVRELATRAATRLGAAHLLRFGATPRRPGEAERLVADVSRLAATGFRPSIALEEAIDRTVDALRARAEGARPPPA